MRDQLIELIRYLIHDRTNKGKVSRVRNLIGSIAHNPQLKQWLTNTYACEDNGHNNTRNFTDLVSSFVQNNGQSFNYDLDTGFVTNVEDDCCDVAIKPYELSKLEILADIRQLFKCEENLSNIELFLFIYGIIKSVKPKCMKLGFACDVISNKIKNNSQLISSVIFNRQINGKLDVECYCDEEYLMSYLNKFDDYFIIDYDYKCVLINNEINIELVLSNSLMVIISNYLMCYLYRFGRQTPKLLQELLTKEYYFAVKFLHLYHNKSILDLIIEWCSCDNKFIFYRNNGDENRIDFICIDDIVMNTEDQTRSLQFDMMYKNGQQFTPQLCGTVCYVEKSVATIISSIEAIDDDISNNVQFTVLSNCVTFYSQKFADLRLTAFLHINDEIDFDVRYFTEISDKQLIAKNTSQLWFVTNVRKVKHFASCFIPITRFGSNSRCDLDDDNNGNESDDSNPSLIEELN